MDKVRVHGTTDREKLKAATAKFMKKALQDKKKNNRSDKDGSN